ncbi:MAG: FtsX-like permease family protein [SAR202 cluster bacterium]|jgi:hypothetical protein|nr:FtsX-like permease family protein [SAR202 cluster bacterium]MDP6714354.1 FtsX-like permease family protein [SAR202 cluster bacterium]
MDSINTISLVMRRLKDDWQLMVSIYLGILVATTLMSGAPVYLDSLERQSIVGSVDSAVTKFSENYLTISTDTDFVPVEEEAIRSTNDAYLEAVERHIAPIHLGTNRHLKMAFHTVSLPRPSTLDAPPGRIVQGFFQNYSGIEDQVTFVAGGMASDTVRRGTQGPMVEAIISDVLAQEFDGLSVGDVVILTPSVEDPSRVSARIVGIFQPIDSSGAYWQGDAAPFVNPRLPDPEGGESTQQPLVLGMFVTENSLVQAVGSAFPGVVVDSVWYASVDREILKSWSSGEMRQRMDDLAEEIALSLPGSFMHSGVNILLLEFERQSFLASVPLLLLMTVMGVTVLYFLFMIVSYLAPARESDIALFRSRGTGMYRLLRLYLIEGTLLTLAAVAIAPFLALGAVWLAGMLPYFQNITDGSPLPVAFDWVPFVTALGAGVLCLLVFVVPGVMGARSGLIIHRLRASRPPSVPFVQRYYIDIGLLVIGGVLFWELQARGQLVSGGLFDQPDVNEALLVAPVLFLLVVALLFFRVFPMFVRYISGESQSLVDSISAVTLLALTSALALREIQAGDRTGWLPEAAILAGVATAYFVTARAESWKLRVPGLLAQATLIALFISREPIDPGQSSVVFVTSIAVALIVPMQLLFFVLAALARRAPIWVSMTLWHMSRNPLQYSWLILLLVLISGIGILATTVGATLDRSYDDRIRYAVGSDVRVSGLPAFFGRRDGGIKIIYGNLNGVDSVSLALRSGGRGGSGDKGVPFSLLAVESDTFDVWYRDDFSLTPLNDLLPRLDVPDPVEPVMIPEDATEIRIWVNPGEYYQLVFLWIVVEDQNGRTKILTLQELGFPGWHLMRADLPDELVGPLRVLAIQINEPGFGAVGTVGYSLFDDLHSFSASTGEEVLLDGFETQLDWIPLATSALGSDELSLVSDVAHNGVSAALFTFGKETNRGTRGFRRASGTGRIPVIASSSFAQATGASLGSAMIVGVNAGLVPIEIVGVVEYFPTVDPIGGGFLIFDLPTLLAYVNGLNPIVEAGVNEFFLTTDEEDANSVFREVSSMVRNQGNVLGVQAELEALEQNPLITAGWRAMVLAAMLIILFTAGLGYVVYLLAFTDRSIGEMGALRSLGLSSMQTAGLIALEHLMVAFIGLGVGTWAGFQMSRMMVSAVTLTDSEGRVLPPFVLSTDWTIMGPIYGLLLLIFLSALFSLGRRMIHLDLRRLSRFEG